MTSGQPLVVLVAYLFFFFLLSHNQQYAYASRLFSSTASSSTNHNRLRTSTKFLGTSAADISSNTRVENNIVKGEGRSTREGDKEEGGSEDDIPDVVDTRRRAQRGLEEEVVRDYDNGSSSSGSGEDDIPPTVLDTRHLEVVRDDSSQDTPTIVGWRQRQRQRRTRSLQEASSTETTTQQTEYVSQNCLNLIAASANSNGHLQPENYFVFTDGYSNGYYTKNNMTNFSDLPEENQHVFITIACGCGPKGESDNCCQMDRAHIDVSGLFSTDGYPKDITNELREVLWDICSTTRDAIGENVLPPSNEGGQGLATAGSSSTIDDSGGNNLGLGPVPEWISDAVNGLGDIVDALDNAEDGTAEDTSPPPVSPVTENEDANVNTRSAETLSPGAIAGIAIAGGVGLLALLVGGVYASRRRKDNSTNQDDDDEDEANRKLQSGPVAPPPNMDEMSGTVGVATQDFTNDDDTQGDYTFASGETVGTETHGGTGDRHPSSSFNGNLDRLGDL